MLSSCENYENFVRSNDLQPIHPWIEIVVYCINENFLILQAINKKTNRISLQSL